MNPQNSPTRSPRSEGTATPGTEGGDSFADTKDKLAQTAKHAASSLKAAATQVASRATEEVQHLATEKKETAADKIGGYGSAVHETANSLEEKDPNIAWFAHRTADKLQSVADYMRTRDLTALRHDAEDLARRHPAAFFGGMFLAGLVLGNVVKASRRNLAPDDESESRWTEDTDSSGEVTSPSDLRDAERAAAGI